MESGIRKFYIVKVIYIIYDVNIKVKEIIGIFRIIDLVIFFLGINIVESSIIVKGFFYVKWFSFIFVCIF